MVKWRSERRKLLAVLAVFAAVFWLPLGWARFDGAIYESLALAKWYAQEHVLLCLAPAFFIAGAIAVFVSHGSVMKYLGAKANKALAYGVASVSGSVLAVCSCTVLPLFAGIWRMGAGLGPAVTFLYSGPAINVLAIILTARILGLELGIARTAGAVGFSIVIGLVMHFMYRKEELARGAQQMAVPQAPPGRPLWQNASLMAALVCVLVFANVSKPTEVSVTLTDPHGDSIVYGGIIERQDDKYIHLRGWLWQSGGQSAQSFEIPRDHAVVAPQEGFWLSLYQSKWFLTAVAGAAIGLMLIFWFGLKWWKVLAAAAPPAVLAMLLPMDGLMAAVPLAAAVAGLAIIAGADKGPAGEWLEATWGFAKQILPLLLAGVMVAGFLLGRVGHEGLIPSKYIQALVGESPNRMLELTGAGGGTFETMARAVWPLWTNLFASIFGALMYFATLTEVPILQGLLDAGMGKGPALALLLSGPSLSLPSMLVIRGVLGTRKTIVYAVLVVVLSMAAGLIFGAARG
jgi:uncharacterized membrane protein YraQ (UPF0718 family)